MNQCPKIKASSSVRQCRRRRRSTPIQRRALCRRQHLGAHPHRHFMVGSPRRCRCSVCCF